MANASTRNRAAFTLTEVMVAMAVTAVLGVVVAQCTVWSLRERARLRAHEAALELAANVLEEARARPWDRLDPDWAASRVVPTAMAELLPEGKVIVTLAPGEGAPHTRRVTVEVSWQSAPHLPPQSVELTTLLSARQAPLPGGKR
jgi:prepilin-type N-terminal cleavage/methylation domain-containing protein